jgi:hypothetical protein
MGARSANFDDVIASANLENLNVGGYIAFLVLVASVVGGVIAWVMYLGGREARGDARTSWGRALGAVSFHVGRIGMVVAALGMVAGVWFGSTSQSPAEKRHSRYRSECTARADADGLTGSARKSRIDACVWSAD